MSAEFLIGARAPAVNACLEYWHGKCTGGRIPGRQHLDPGEMKSFLPYVIIFDVERHPSGYRFRHRLVGTHVADLFGSDMTGEYVDETSAAGGYTPILRQLSAVAETRAPSFGVYAPPTPHRNFIEYEHLTLPLAADGELVDMLFGVGCGLKTASLPTSRCISVIPKTGRGG